MARLGWTAGAVAGSLIASLGVSAMMIAGERQGGGPSELIALGRASARRAGFAAPTEDALPDAGEQAWTQGGHLALGVAVGLAYAALTDEDAPVVTSGLALGTAFYLLAHVIGGPALRVKAPEWRQETATIGKHLMVHALFGLITAACAKAGANLPR